MIWRCERKAPARDGGRGQEAGFTLIEVIVVLAVLAFALALIVGYKPPWSSGLGLRGTAAELASSLRLARSEAILQNRPVLFELDLSGRRFRVGNGTVRQLPRQLSIELLTVSGERRDFATGDIRFNPDGSSTGGRISLADGRQKMAVGIDWLSGRVSVADVQ
jgi:general secretion pathway protein H